MIKPPVVILSLVAIIAALPFRAGAQDAGAALDRTTSRYEANAKLAQQALAKGDDLFARKHYDEAVQQYKFAVDNLPDASTTASLRRRALSSLGEACVRLGEQRITEGRFDDATAAAKTILNYDPNYRPAVELLAHMEDRRYFNHGVGPKFEDKVHEVQRLFVEAKGFYDTARWDLAYKRCDQILDIDPYNTAARHLQEDIEAAKSKYADEAYSETRSLLLWQVTKEWETAPKKYINRQAVYINTNTNTNNNEAIQIKLQRIVIPSLKLTDAKVSDALNFLHTKSVDLDSSETEPSKRGVNFFLKLTGASGGAAALPAPAPEAAPPAEAVPGLPTAAPIVAPAQSTSLADKRITLSLNNIPLGEALRYVCELAGLKYKVEAYAVTIVPLSEPTTNLVTKEYKVPPGFLTTNGPTTPGLLNGPPGGGIPGGAAPGGAVGAPLAPSAIPTRPSAMDYLKNAGVIFGPNASAEFIPSNSKLVVRNTEEQMDLVDRIVDALNAATPSQVSIMSKFVEIEQTNYKELSFDYSLGTGNIGKIEYSGGNTIAPTTTFPFTNIFGGGQVTSALRSGGEAITGDAIDTLLNPSVAPPGTAAPATFALAGVVTSAQFQAIIRLLNQRRGVDLLSAPSVTTKSGQRAVIEVVVEFRYPTEFEPPKVPNINAVYGGVVVGGGGGGVGGGALNGAGYTPVTPTTPTTFETRNTGVTLEVEPTVGADGETIDLNLSPQVVEFDGFVNYGSPIYGPPTPIFSPLPPFAQIGTGPATIITANTINQPVFDTRKVTTSVSVWDNQTVIIGGLVREDVQTVNDKVPGLGDLPILGRFFRSDVDQHTKRNLVMFVTAHLVNPAGDAVHAEDEQEEDVAPSRPPELPVTPELPDLPAEK